MLSIQQCATLACLLEVTAPKPGNVHRGADFEDVTFLDFVNSAVAIGPAMQNASRSTLGQCIREAITDTRAIVNTNTNLGIVLLLAPLAKTGRTSDRKSALRSLLDNLTSSDAEDVFAAIRLVQPGGLGSSPEMDVNHDLTQPDLMAAMRIGADRDLIASQYATGFEFLLDELVPRLAANCGTYGLVSGIVNVYVWLLATKPDSLIARKCGPETAIVASEMAQRVLDAGDPHREESAKCLSDLDFWLRSDGHRRNPGTSADMITAAIFVNLLENCLDVKTT